jgi:hypothetical protein
MLTGDAARCSRLERIRPVFARGVRERIDLRQFRSPAQRYFGRFPSLADSMARSNSWSTGANLTSALGAGVIGAGLALISPQALRAHAALVLVFGIAIHAIGTTLKYRLEHRDGPPRWWERLLFWSCWATLAMLGAWIAVDLWFRQGVA